MNAFPPAQQREFAESSRLLGEVLEYMLRLPAVPTTVELARKVQQQLSRPEHALAVEAAKESARRLALRHGVNYTPAGIPVVEVEIDGDVVRLWTPPKEEWRGREAPVLRRLRKVETIRLTDGPALHFKRVDPPTQE